MKKSFQFLKFGIVGGINTINSLILYYLLIYFNFKPLIAVFISYIISSIIGYFLNKIWVFKKKNIENKKTLVKYYIVYGSSLLLNVLIMYFLIDIVFISKLFAPVIVLCFLIPYNFFLSKNWVYTNDDFYTFLNKSKIFIMKNKSIVIVLILFLITIIPMFLNNLYNHPVADDYSNYNNFMYYLNGQTINLYSVIKTSISLSWLAYKTWQGTFFSNILFYFNPLLISIEIYKCISFIMQLFYISSVLFFFSCLSKIKNFINLKKSLMIGMIYLILSITFIYSPSEGFYWFTSIVLYLLPFSLSMIFLGLLILYETKSYIYVYILLIILAICLAGTNYITGLFLGSVILLITIYSFLTKIKRRLSYLILLIIFGIAFAFNVFCPGNFFRMAYFVDTTVIKALLMVFPLSFNMLFDVFFKTLIIPSFILLMPIFFDISRKSKCKFPNPIFIIFIVFIIFNIFFTPGTYAYGTFYEEARVKNIQFFYLLICMIVILFNIVGYFAQNKQQLFLNKNFSMGCYIIGIMSLLLMTSSIGIDNFKSKMIADDIIYGVSVNYNKCMYDMYNRLLNTDEDIVIIKNCEKFPRTLYYYPLSNDKTWVDTATEIYFGKQIIVE